VLSSGDLIAAGRFLSDQDLGGETTHMVNGASDAFVGRYQHVDGQQQWALDSAGGAVDGIDGLSAGPNNTIYAVGAFSTPSQTPFVLANNQPDVASQDFDGYVARIGENGAVQQVRAFGGTGVESVRAVAAPLAGSRVVIAGEFTETLGSFGIGSRGGGDIYVVSLDRVNLDAPAQTLQIGGGGADLVHGVAVGIPGSPVIVVGSLLGEVNFGMCESCTISGGGQHGFVARLEREALLEPTWVRPFGDDGETQIRAVALGGDGRVYIAGTFTGTVTFGALGSATSLGGSDAFTARLSALGVPEWFEIVAGPEEDVIDNIAVDRDGRVVFAGSFAGGARLGDVDVTSAGGSDLLVGSFDPRP
jgi:hypothetical protein